MATPTIGTEREEWRPVVGTDGKYEVSSLGRVRNAKTGKVCVASVSDRGYLRLHRRSIHGTSRVHRMVAIAFLGPVPPGMEVNHINGNKADNRVVNLEYTSRSGNMKHGFKAGIIKRRLGEDRHQSKLKNHHVLYIRASDATASDLSKMLGVSKRTISAIRRRDTWKHI